MDASDPFDSAGESRRRPGGRAAESGDTGKQVRAPARREFRNFTPALRK